MRHPGCVVAIVLALAATACGGGTGERDAAGTTEDARIASGTQRHPDVVAATATETPDGWTIEATLSSPYDSPARYADAWRALDPDGTVLGVRELLHHHAAEQPFTRSLTGVQIPDGVEEITIEGRDQQYGWGGETVTISLDRGP